MVQTVIINIFPILRRVNWKYSYPTTPNFYASPRWTHELMSLCMNRLKVISQTHTRIVWDCFQWFIEEPVDPYVQRIENIHSDFALLGFASRWPVKF